MTHRPKQKTRFQRALEHRVLGPAMLFIPTLTVGTSLTYGILFGTCDNGVREQIEPHLEEIMKAQEERVGIKHGGKPAIVYKIDFNPFVWISAQYKPKEDALYLNPHVHWFIKMQKLLGFAVDPALWDAKTVVEHELGHFYTDKLGEQMGNGNSLDFSHTSDSESLGLRLVTEGIGEYFGRKGKGQLEHDVFSNAEFPQDNEGWLNLMRPHNLEYLFLCLYQGGYHLVKPILDQDVERGIRYLIVHPPTERDLNDLPVYQQRALDVLAKENQR